LCTLFAANFDFQLFVIAVGLNNKVWDWRLGAKCVSVGMLRASSLRMYQGAEKELSRRVMDDRSLISWSKTTSMSARLLHAASS
jgi:hypothetical protein